MKEPIPLSVEEPIACSLDGAGMADRLAEFRELFADGLVGRDRTAEGIRFRFRASEGMESRVRDLARRENECCPFFTFTITVAGGEVLWDASAPDDARPILDNLYRLPETPEATTSVPPSNRRKVATTGIAAALCALACALPAFVGAALLWGGMAVAVVGVVLATLWLWRRSRPETEGGPRC
jgi:hypothetical protein